jgi:hypothetical protein
MTLHAMHRKRLFHQEFGVENEEDSECFREHKRFLSEELSLRIAELKLNSNTNPTVVTNTNVTPININGEGMYDGDSMSPTWRNRNGSPTSSPTNLSRAYKAKQRALMVYTPPIITATDAEGETITISTPQILRTDVFDKLKSKTPHPLLMNHIFKNYKPSQYVNEMILSKFVFREIVLYRDPQQLLKEAYDKVKSNEDTSPSTPMDFESNVNSPQEEVIEEIQIDTDAMQDDDQD